MCEQGKKHVDWVNFDQINKADMEVVDIPWGTMQFWREIPCMEVVPLMSGAKCEEAHHLHKEEDGSHRSLCFMLWYFDYMVYLDI